MSTDAINRIRYLANEAAREYAETVVPGVSDDSVLEARRDTLDEVLAILSEDEQPAEQELTEYYSPRGLALEGEAYDQLESRIGWGREAIETNPDQNDLETDASDVISNILTSLYGPSGVTVCTLDSTDPRGVSYSIDSWKPSEAKAQALLDRAFRSWQGDAEDYDVDLTDEA